MRIVLDTNILLGATFSNKGSCYQLVKAGLAGELVWVCSVALMLEYEEVLKRPEHLKKSGALTEEIDQILIAAAAVIEPVRFSFLWRPELNDPNDEMILEAAVNGRANLVVTMNLRHLEAGLRRFGIPALGPGDSLRWIRSKIQ